MRMFSSRRFKPLAFILTAALLLGGCETVDETWDDIFGDDEEAPRSAATRPGTAPSTTSAARNQPATSTSDEPRRYTYTIGESAQQAEPVFRETMTDRRLADIYEEQQALYAEIEADPTGRDEPEYERRLRAIGTEYESLLLDSPDYAYGYLMYGKFLRRTGNPRAANNAFLKANMLDPNFAVAKQQIGNFLAEEGEYGLALPYYLSAIELEPDEPLYRYQLGELLYSYRDFYVDSGKFDRPTIDQNMLDAFHAAVERAPDNREFRQRYAEAFFDVESPDWDEAMKQWNVLMGRSESDLQRELIQLQRARILIELKRPEEARLILNRVERPSLQEARTELQERL